MRENIPTIQLTYILEETERGRRLSPRRMLETNALPHSVELPDAGRLFTLEAGDRCVLLSPTSGIDVRINGKDIRDRVRLFPGDKIQAGGYLLNFHLKHESHSLSFASRALSLGAKLAVGIFLACEIAVMFGLSPLLLSRGLFEGSMERQRISYKAMMLHNRINSIKAEDSMETAMLELLRNDISKRMGYIGDFGETLSPRQRKEMETDLRRLDLLLDMISKEGKLLPDTGIEYEETVKEIIERHNYRLQ